MGFAQLVVDGTMHEVINGMLKRKKMGKCFIGLITGGTGNAFMHDMECLDPIESVERIMKGHLRPVDIARVDANGQLFYAFNIIGWGMVTDATSLAEKLRCLERLVIILALYMKLLRVRKEYQN